MASLGEQERVALARKRLLSVLGTLTVANQRTLEQKISDAGPSNQRIDPHVLTPVRRQMMHEGIIGAVNAVNAPWFYASNIAPDARQARLNELVAIYKPYLDMGHRIGQALEIATYRALSKIPNADFQGRFVDLDDHDDSTLYSKEEPPGHIGTRAIPGKQRLDFVLRLPDAGPLGIECKNVRPWMYPHEPELRDMIRKCVAIDAVPVLIARRIPFVTFTILSRCGVIMHQTYNQLMPGTEAKFAAKVRDKMLLGYHDVRLGNVPDERLTKFVTVNLPKVAAGARELFKEYYNLLAAYGAGMDYEQFAARVLRRSRGEDEDWGPNGPPQE